MTPRFRRAVYGALSGVLVTVLGGIALTAIERYDSFDHSTGSSAPPIHSRVYLNALLLATRELAESIYGTKIASANEVLRAKTVVTLGDAVRLSTFTVVDDNAAVSDLVRIEFLHADEYTQLPATFLIKDLVLQTDEPVALSQLVAELKRAGVVIVEDERLSSPCEGTRVTVRHERSNQSGAGLACDEFFQ